jgi:16S rRNA (cytosine1402-N4)-methyltransferase
MQEVLAAIVPAPGLRVLDCTLGLGGHAEALLAGGATVWGIDRDPAARALAEERLASFGDAFRVLSGTFAEVTAGLRAAGERFDAVLADLGVSSMQLDDGQRGFSIRSEAPADMRMGDGCPADAIELIRSSSADELADILYQFGEERRSRAVARALKAAVERDEISGAQLAAAVRGAIPGHQQRHPALRSFQALRIAVNGELDQLRALLAILPQLLCAGGRAVVISFHSLEDRLVKESFRAGKATGIWDDIARRVQQADAAEEARNPRSAPAKLRWARRAGAGAAP